MRCIERIVYREHARLIIWRRSVRIPCDHHHSVWNKYDNGIDIGENYNWRLLGLRARIRSVVQGVICWAHKIIDYRPITLLLMTRGHTASLESQISLHYGEACPPAICLSVSQLRTLLQNTRYIKYQTSNIRIQPTSKYLFPSSISATHPHLVVVIIYQLLINQLINKACIN